MESTVESLLKIIIGIQGLIIVAFFAQLISNLVIIFQLPKIKRLCEEMCYEEEE